ncbi:MAG: serine protease [Candidatus Moranbacteria bacterium]|nr:serine protease [Candidatus Moranbacteria bacterium]OIQ03511.1 MAG: hypothetical protein AUK58_01850 [Candidatus Moranbacteria bacterium CG2_30_41_165]PIP25288.1 MAG: hypothetical protein COX32_04345 [Candidatus Moranbacteria bacterium CG23_combo_of_CG06-09_8_20_14_all_41_28]PIV86572.1 MAG: hypothetical protein COW50_00635 [Candidatus Moranbacteria bacterium CG17_big_fil_post_rev_8_21_14_2_50_41_107]PIW94175.1 MAG: hypothetical protein COZ86_02435 [Candidatus Moranbacteria bacterium CG_4_8_1
MKKTFFVLLFVLSILLFGALGSILLNAYLPKIASLPLLNTWSVLKKATDRVTIINKTEQIIVAEDDTVEKIVSQPATAVVNIVTTLQATSPLAKGSVGILPVKTGVLVTNDGLIVSYSSTPLTKEMFEYSVILFDGTVQSADFLGYDTLTNIFFLRLTDAKNTPSIAFANSDDARVGKKLIALGGSSLPYQNRLATGILSNINHSFNLSGKTVASSEKMEGILETDFVATEKFIGGPAVGYNGEMIGLMGSLLIDNISFSFLIPANSVRESLDRMIKGEMNTRVTLGAYYLPLTKTLALQMKLPLDAGALIYSPSGKTGLAILAGSSAMKAGLEAGDIIKSVDGKSVTLTSPLPLLLTPYHTGESVKMLVWRKGAEQEISVQF